MDLAVGFSSTLGSSSSSSSSSRRLRMMPTQDTRRFFWDWNPEVCLLRDTERVKREVNIGCTKDIWDTEPSTDIKATIHPSAKESKMVSGTRRSSRMPTTMPKARTMFSNKTTKPTSTRIRVTMDTSLTTPTMRTVDGTRQ